MFELVDEGGERSGASIKVIGVGGAGGNAVNRMMESGLSGVEFIVANTDAQVLVQSRCPRKIQLGTAITKGLGSGANPSVGRQSAEADEAVIQDWLRHIECPTLVIAADPAPPYFPPQVRDTRLARLRDARVEVVAGGPHLHMEQPAVVGALLRAFLSR